MPLSPIILFFVHTINSRSSTPQLFPRPSSLHWLHSHPSNYSKPPFSALNPSLLVSSLISFAKLPSSPFFSPIHVQEQVTKSQWLSRCKLRFSDLNWALTFARKSLYASLISLSPLSLIGLEIFSSSFKSPIPHLPPSLLETQPPTLQKGSYFLRALRHLLMS